MSSTVDFTLNCPLPLQDYPRVLLAHGGGGKLMHRLISSVFATAFADLGLQPEHDAAVLAAPAGRLAFTTDSFVVQPRFFPGGDIGSLAVHGTVNDLAMMGATPLYLSVACILEEGLPMAELWHIAQSLRNAALTAGVRIVTGDTKVVERGKGDGIFITTSGVGVLPSGVDIGPHRIAAGDALVVNGDLGRHGMAIMAAREGLAFESAITSDSAALNHLVAALLAAGLTPHCLRDLTRGGLASGLNELATAAALGMDLDERVIPVREDVRGACEILGFDPLYVANEGRFVALLPAAQAPAAVALLRGLPHGDGAAIIGQVTPGPAGQVTLRRRIGAPRLLDMLSGEQLPRIC